ncbi:4'-phosphopantetheinyl transferase superfamily protein [Streptomyces sp. H27-C3]|uniref:4'-phosphopantetheinyl transferase family protein n=1 Tax=Streptomyces sp. H27-C3 TaxID=3046305 RepID=UPI0024BA5E9D|nr:4'-phosphopantetheinyl transferase superfamily protein [Streptomyces sp. H27-C3]MDJ0466255.1 4'-phosphopantetheinyl transferase superfamily protein [Streptomyces sp. H27-C3]
MTPTAGALAVGRGELDVWLIPPPEASPYVQSGELDGSERRRAAAYRRPGDRLLYIAAHVGLRRILSAYTGIAPGRLAIAGVRHNAEGGRHGRPVILGVPGAPQFSLSHSRGLALLAVARGRVGADVQGMPTAATADACLPALHPAERDELSGIPERDRTRAFCRLWTRKEAYLKGLGTGLARRPSLDYLGESGLGERPEGWAVGDLPLCSSHAGAVAVPGSGGHRIAMRVLPAGLLHAPDAVERIRGIVPVLRTVLPPAEQVTAPAG